MAEAPRAISLTRPRKAVSVTVDDILRKQAQENRVTDTPDLFVGIHKEGFKFAGCKDTTFCRSRRADRGRSQFLPEGNVKRMVGFPSGFVCTL